MEIPPYRPEEIEPKWSRIWEETGVYEPDLDAPPKPYYNLTMFPYPSAEGLHVGHAFTFPGGDVFGRFKRMLGHDVFQPMGLDGFGIHSENYALKVGEHPMDLAQVTEKRFYDQLSRLGVGFAWKEKLETYDPEYYRWTQWLFLQLFKAGLAVQKTAPVNWCPKDLTVLADEQVISGKCERCGSVVERRDLKQWFFKITDYADRLDKNLETLDWDPVVLRAQKNWIGKSEGASVRFPIKGSDKVIEVFTTRPDTLFGATFLILAPDHPAVEGLAGSAKAEVESYRKDVAAQVGESWEREMREKTGVRLEQVAINPATGEEIPIWIADYVSTDYGTGAIMAVPAHDARDFEFARKFDLPVVRVIDGGELPYDGDGTYIESGFLDGKTTSGGVALATEWLVKNGHGEAKTTYRLRDWLISRQRYWGPPIPIIHCEACGAVPVPEADLPVVLPRVEEFRPTGTGQSPLATVKEFYETTCPECSGSARRETDVSDTFLDSSWYYLRYPSVRQPADEERPFDSERLRTWLPVDSYIGGREHAVLHLLYARFIAMALHDLKQVDFEEPFTRFRANGLLTMSGSKMSKSKGNVRTPDEYIDRYGADALRLSLLFLGPFSQGAEFSDRAMPGMQRYLGRIWRFVQGYLGEVPQTGESAGGVVGAALLARRSEAITGVTREISEVRYNTAIAIIMAYFNELSALRDRHGFAEDPAGWREGIETLLLLLAPFAPFIAEELWERLGQTESIHRASWPEAPEVDLSATPQAIPVQIDGKVRDQLLVDPAASEEAVVAQALQSEKVQRYVSGKYTHRYVPGRILSFSTEK